MPWLMLLPVLLWKILYHMGRCLQSGVYNLAFYNQHRYVSNMIKTAQ